MKRGTLYGQHVSRNKHGNKAVADTIRSVAKSGFKAALIFLEDGRLVSGRLVPVTPRSRSEFKVMTGYAGRPTTFHIKDVSQVSLPGQRRNRNAK